MIYTSILVAAAVVAVLFLARRSTGSGAAAASPIARFQSTVVSDSLPRAEQWEVELIGRRLTAMRQTDAETKLLAEIQRMSSGGPEDRSATSVADVPTSADDATPTTVA